MGAKIVTFGLVIIAETASQIAFEVTKDSTFDTVGTAIGSIGALLMMIGVLGWIGTFLGIFTPTKKVGSYTVSADNQMIGSGDIYGMKDDEELKDDWSFATKSFVWGLIIVLGAVIGMVLGINISGFL